jgi:hypothetical protein
VPGGSTYGPAPVAGGADLFPPTLPIHTAPAPAQINTSALPWALEASPTSAAADAAAGAAALAGNGVASTGQMCFASPSVADTFAGSNAAFGESGAWLPVGVGAQHADVSGTRSEAVTTSADFGGASGSNDYGYLDEHMHAAGGMMALPMGGAGGGSSSGGGKKQAGHKKGHGSGAGRVERPHGTMRPHTKKGVWTEHEEMVLAMHHREVRCSSKDMCGEAPLMGWMDAACSASGVV